MQNINPLSEMEEQGQLAKRQHRGAHSHPLDRKASLLTLESQGLARARRVAREHSMGTDRWTEADKTDRGKVKVGRKQGRDENGKLHGWGGPWTPG